jgi:hypothetical protein
LIEAVAIGVLVGTAQFCQPNEEETDTTEPNGKLYNCYFPVVRKTSFFRIFIFPLSVVLRQQHNLASFGALHPILPN